MNKLLSSINKAIAIFFIGISTMSAAHANVVLSGTRVIYPETEKEVTLKVNNKGKTPVLIQSWIDTGNANASPDSISSPFLLTPPMNRIDPEKGQTLRISYTDVNSLPKDRESLFWLNVLEIPPKVNDSATPNHLQVAFRSRIKIFFRPTGINGDAFHAAESVQWTLQNNAMVAKNDTPYYVNLLGIHTTENSHKIVAEGTMISPFSSITVKINPTISPRPGDKLSYDFINDWGAVKTTEFILR
ncbi:molecular chaperone [Hafnia paralvei]|jgi:chaperone protein EcpD|nr:fimbria/pilus periplasmic chaperone [Hafnia paralvei]KHS43538.1 molecular chaperone [Hafnia paralvei]MCE9881230.1 fimbria/pilus periplasmic chaperone [Hafnia paralvei]MCE9909850.1 fimbria/pilus periplasmic chaperone [Hafnia paralvei]MCE9911171.1 fimbria/pilus periplasmic chaperone [Hafnia paralvei]NUN43626.1 fimbria/pilus periplasmic chaperone [Hafnia paralvei]